MPNIFVITFFNFITLRFFYVFIKNNEIQAWEKQIVEIFENYEMSNLIASNARKIVTENNNLLKFNKKLDSIIFD